MRDHLLGFPPVAAAAIEAEEIAAHGWGYGNWPDPYPLGVPKRAIAEYEAGVAAEYPPRDPKLDEFENAIFENPDGTRTTSRGVVFIVQQARMLQALAENIEKNSVRFHAVERMKGISCKPVPGSALTVDSVRAVVRDELQALGNLESTPKPDAMAQGIAAHSAQFEQAWHARDEAMKRHEMAAHATAMAHRGPEQSDPAPAAAVLGIVDAYMACFGHARTEETATMNQHAAEKRAAFNAERQKRIYENQQARAMGEANAQGVALSRIGCEVEACAGIGG